jgi:hypothetical protein
MRTPERRLPIRQFANSGNSSRTFKRFTGHAPMELLTR